MTYVKIRGKMVATEILTAKLSCDYEKCKGACCNASSADDPNLELVGGYLSDYEAAEIVIHRKELASLCDHDVTKEVLEHPVIDDGNAFYTSLKGKNGKCLLCSLEKGTCVLKLAHKKNPNINIPISCQLYPILWTTDENDTEWVKLGHTFDARFCHFAYEKGKAENVYLIDFLEDAIKRSFGEKFFTALKWEQQYYIDK